MGFKAVSMSEVNLFLQKENLDKVTDLIYNLKLIEFFEMDEKNFETFDTSDLNDISKRLLKLRSGIDILNKYFKINTNKTVEDPIDSTIKLKNDLDELEKKVISLTDDINRNNILNALKVTNDDLKSDKISIGFLPLSESKTLKKLSSNKIKFKSYKSKKRIYFVANSDKIPFTYKEFYLPKKLDAGLEIKLERTQTAIINKKVTLRNVANGNLENLKFEEKKLTKEIEILESKPKFLKTENIVIISGFVPTNLVRKLKIELIKTLNDKFDIVTKDAGDDAPIQLDHFESVSKFQEILKMYSLPKYNEIDPTFILFLTFPLFFGFILGDVLYGLISLLFFTWMKTKMPKIKDFMTIFQISSWSSIFFGIIFGEFMGYEIHGSFYGLLARSHDTNALLLIAAIFGVVHINLGLIFGFLNLRKTKLKAAICDKLSLIIFQIGLGILVYGMNISSNLLTIIGSVLGIFALVLVYMGHGVIGILEVPSFFTNVLSYSRLMAVGLSSVVIAMLVNQFTGVFFDAGIGGKIAGVLLFTVGHIFNIVLGNFEGFVHTLRLHYVEFFTKFYSGDGREFIPFGAKKSEE